MKIAIVSSSQIAQFGRMDAGFHIAYAEVKDRVAALADRMGADEIAEAIGKIDLADLVPLRVLSRGQDRVWNRAIVDRIVADYPHIAMVLLQDGLETTIREKAQAKVADSKAYLEMITEIAGKLAEDADLQPAAPSPR